MNFKQFVRDYFTFSRNERKGVIILLLIIFVLAIANKMIFYLEKPATLNKALFDSAKHELAAFSDSVNLETQTKELKSGIRSSADDNLPINSSGKEKNETYPGKEAAVQLFKFDPNKCSDLDFQNLGFSEKQVRAIRKYIDAGAVFRSAEDFFRIKVITEKQKETIGRWIEIERENGKVTESKAKSKSMEVELNSADSVALEQLPGIGKALSKRIVKYRDLLGGFYSIDQLKEVYGLSESAINQIENKIRIDKQLIRKVDFNFGEMGDLSRHPYIKRNLAGKIIKFRSKYGKISDLAVLKDSLVLTGEEYERIEPYF